MKKTFCLCFGFHLVSWFMKKSLSFFNDAKIRQKYSLPNFLLKKSKKLLSLSKNTSIC